MSKVSVKGIANADLSAVQYEGVIRTGTSERIAASTLPTQDILGIQTTADADAAGERCMIDIMGVTKMEAGEALQPFDEITAGTAGTALKAEYGEVVIGRYIPELRAGGTDMPAAASGDHVRVVLYGSRAVKTAAATIQFTFDPSANASERTIATHSTGLYLPDNAVVIDSGIDVITTFTSATDAATIAIGSSEAVVDAAIAISDGTNPWDSGLRVGDIVAGGAGTKTTSRQVINVTVAVEALTAGKLVCWLTYIISE